MTPKQARDFIDTFKGKPVKSFVKPSHLEELSPLHEVHIEAVEVRKDEFHEMDGGKSYMPKKETLDKFAAAAGVSYNEAAESTRLEGDGCYVGRSQAMLMGPDGQMVYGSACEYEFDVGTRTDEAEINGKADWDNKDQYGRPGKIPFSQLELKAKRLEFRKVGRQRANTGARNRATVAILGIPTGIKGLFSKKDPDDATRIFLFSRIIINSKNKMVMDRMLDNLAGNTAALFGPAQSAPALPAHTASAERPMRSVEPAPEPKIIPPAAPAGRGVDALFDGEPTDEDLIEATRNALNDYLNSALLNSEQKAKLTPIVNDPATGLETLRKYLDMCSEQERRRKARAAS